MKKSLFFNLFILMINCSKNSKKKINFELKSNLKKKFVKNFLNSMKIEPLLEFPKIKIDIQKTN